MAQQVLTDLDFNGVSRVLNLPNATLPQQPATFGQVNALVEGLAWKDNVRLAAPANVTLSAPGVTIDGLTMVANDTFLAANQTAQGENGTYVWNGPAVAATRLFTMSQSIDFNSAVVTVDAGSSAGVTLRQTAVNPVVGTTAILFVPFGTTAPNATTGTPGLIALASQAEVDAGAVANKTVTPATLAAFAGRVRKYATNLGDGAATQYTLTHNLNTQDVVMSCRRATGAYDNVQCDMEATTVNTVTFRFAVAPAVNAFRGVVVG